MRMTAIAPVPGGVATAAMVSVSACVCHTWSHISPLFATVFAVLLLKIEKYSQNSHFRLAKPDFLCILRVPTFLPLVVGSQQKQHINRQESYEDHRYSRSYSRRPRVLPAAAAAAGDSHSGAHPRCPH